MVKKTDIGSKRLVSLAPDNWVQWVTQRPQVKAGDILASEFQWLSRESDVLVRATDPEVGQFLVLTEVQLRYPERMPRRIRAYAALAEERYDLPTYPVLINVLPPSRSPQIPDRYESNVLGLTARQDYRVINLWEIEAELVFRQPLPALLPFVPILKGGDSEPVVRQALQTLRADARLNELEPLLAFFAGFVFEIPLIQQIMRWDMAVLRESPWYQQILQEGRAEGRAEGQAEGRAEGRAEEAIKFVVRLVNRRFGEVDPQFRQRLQTLSLGQLEELGEIVFDFNRLEEIEAWLDEQF